MTRDEEIEKAAEEYGKIGLPKTKNTDFTRSALELQVMCFKAGAKWERKRAKGLVEVSEKVLFALQCMIISWNGPCPGLTEEQVFNGACDTRDELKDVLKHYQGEGNG